MSDIKLKPAEYDQLTKLILSRTVFKIKDHLFSRRDEKYRVWITQQKKPLLVFDGVEWKMTVRRTPEGWHEDEFTTQIYARIAAQAPIDLEFYGWDPDYQERKAEYPKLIAMNQGLNTLKEFLDPLRVPGGQEIAALEYHLNNDDDSFAPY